MKKNMNNFGHIGETPNLGVAFNNFESTIIWNLWKWHGNNSYLHVKNLSTIKQIIISPTNPCIFFFHLKKKSNWRWHDLKLLPYGRMAHHRTKPDNQMPQEFKLELSNEHNLHQPRLYVHKQKHGNMDMKSKCF